MKRIAIILLIAALAAGWGAAWLSASTTPQVTPTNRWANFYGLASTLDGAPLPIGSVIRAYDPDGVNCGEWVVNSEGVYGMMPVYGDDVETSADEGAEEGDTITFTINGWPASPIGPDAPVWSWGTLRHVELVAFSGAATATPTATSESPGKKAAEKKPSAAPPPRHRPQLRQRPAPPRLLPRRPLPRPPHGHSHLHPPPRPRRAPCTLSSCPISPACRWAARSIWTCGCTPTAILWTPWM